MVVVVDLGKMIAPPCCPTECAFAAPPHATRNGPAAAVMMRALVFILVGYTSPLGSSSPGPPSGVIPEHWPSREPSSLTLPRPFRAGDRTPPRSAGSPLDPGRRRTTSRSRRRAPSLAARTLLSRRGTRRETSQPQVPNTALPQLRLSRRNGQRR